FMGVALYPKVTLSESFALGLRAEYFQIKKGYLIVSDENGDPVPFAFARDTEGTGSVTAFTLSANYKVGGLTIIPELRSDMTSEDSYVKKGEVNPSKQMLSFNLATVYKF
ncbi:MAG: outer membrane beta-barrel protein, partial [Bacteroidota bacterium]